MKELEAKYKSKFRNKLKWYKQDQNNPLLKCIIDDFDSTISDAFQELENRSCSNCKHWINEAFSANKNDLKGFCSLFGICNGDLSHDMSNDFCCNKWKNKD